ncbi:sensor histidine kinase [Faecalicatena contorta]|uniref:sensor histidine kinase n=1 Tax=Faecalicatena contorta TaxID=39482 RepID=UPI0018991C1F|nr:sensor histidine kinase [Faecalicatena contorta]
MKKLIKLFTIRLRSIRFTLTVVVAVLILISVFLSSMLSYARYAKDSERQSSVQTQQTLEQLAYNINNYLDELFRLTTYLYYDNTVINEFEKSSGNEVERLQKRRIIENYLDQIMIMPRKDVLNVFVITDEIYYSGRMPKSIDHSIDYSGYDWYKDALQNKKSAFIPPHLEQIVSYPKNTVFSIVKPLKSIQNIAKVIGVIKVDASYSGISEIAEKVKMGNDGGVFIIDSQKNLIYSSIKTEKIDLLSDTALIADNSWTQKIDGTEYLMNTANVKNSDWTIVSVNSLEELTANARQTRDFTLLLATISSLSAIIVLLIFANRFLQPLLEIVQLMKEVRKGNFQVHFLSKRQDEIGYLGDSFNSMVQTINENIQRNTQLATQVYEANALHTQAQLNALQSQIKPHFLYNTLNMISMQIQLGKSEQAVDNIDKLHQLLRGMAKWNREVTLANEYSVLDCYLGIQRSRFEERLEYELSLEKELYYQYILAFILQPIVENAIIHGLEKQRAKTRITVNGFTEGQFTFFIVADTGKGMTDEQLTALKEKLEQAASRPQSYSAPGTDGHIGLENVSNRIKLHYGSQYGIHINSEPDAGTRVTVKLPLLKKEAQENV